MRNLVRLRKRPSRNGKQFAYLLDFEDGNGNRRRISLGHSDKQKAKKQRTEKEAELSMIIKPKAMTLTDLIQEHLSRTRGQVRDSTLMQHDVAIRHLVDVVGDIDIKKLKYQHGEYFIQACLDRGNAASTVNKKIRCVNRVFQLAVQRSQLETNPFLYLHKPKSTKRKVITYSDQECNRLIEAARQIKFKKPFDWQMLIILALCTGMRRGELLNTTWRDIDFEKATIEVAPKRDSVYTWLWYIKDIDRRILPLTEDVLAMLIERQGIASSCNPYVFIPDWRFELIQRKRQKENWTVDDGKIPVNNFSRHFEQILVYAGIEHKEFHDIRRTCLSRWLKEGLSEFEIMTLAGHSDFQTTHRFYLAVREDVLDRARLATAKAMALNIGARPVRLARAAQKGESDYPRCDSNAQPLAPEANALSN